MISGPRLEHWGDVFIVRGCQILRHHWSLEEARKAASLETLEGAGLCQQFAFRLIASRTTRK